MDETEFQNKVRVLCAQMGLTYPLEEKALTVGTVIFTGPTCASPRTLQVLPTDVNRGMRLFIQSIELWLRESSGVITSQMRTMAKAFSTDRRWDDCSYRRRPIVAGLQHYKKVQILRKETTVDDIEERLLALVFPQR